jgi:5-methylcytosine-specific restriction endonuclease McrA
MSAAARSLVTCRACGREWFAPNRHWKVCSAECRAELHRRSARAAYYAYDQHDRSPRPCKGCGAVFTPSHASQKFHTKRCCLRFHARGKPGTREARRRARRHGVAYEPIIIERVFERDGWKCQICGKRTPKERRGTRYSNAPELDHRVPLSRGGGHTYENVQCACRACNMKKRDRSSAGQLPMFARPAARRRSHG